MINPYNPASKRPPFNSLQEALKFEHSSAEERRARRRLERNADPEWQEIRRIRQEITDKEQAEKAAKAAEAAKHAMVGWPGGLSAHVDRRSAQAKASFVRYLVQAVEDYERDHPDQAPAPTATDIADEIAHARELESRARARRLLEDGVPVVEKAKMLEVRHPYMGDEETMARVAARQQLKPAADPLGGEQLIEHQDDPTPTPALKTTDPEPVKRGRGRPSKASRIIEMTDDGALFE